jgi:serine/threonine protein kinase
MPKTQNIPKWKIENWKNHTLITKDKTFTIIKYFGQSGFGHLFIALTSENYLVILKIFNDNKNYSNEVESIKNAQKILNEYLLPYLDYFIYTSKDHFNYPILVFKFMEGYIPLSQHLKDFLFFQDLILALKEELNQILQKIHKLSLVHNALNLDLILIHPENGQIKFFDLGFCIHRWVNKLSENEFKQQIEKDLMFVFNL